MILSINSWGTKKKLHKPVTWICWLELPRLETFWVSLSSTKSKGSTHVSLGEGSGKKLEMFLLKKRWLSWSVNLIMVKLDKFDHIYLVYHFTVPLSFFFVALFHLYLCMGTNWWREKTSCRTAVLQMRIN